MENIRPKSETISRICTSILKGFSTYFSVSYHHADRLLPLKGSPFFLLSKHQAVPDIVFPALLLRDVLDRTGYYLNRPDIEVLGVTLPTPFLERIGGIPVIRKRDAERKGLPQSYVDEVNKRAYEYIAKLMQGNETVVIYPENKRNYQKVGRLSKSTLENILSVQERLGKKIPMVSMDIAYPGFWSPRSEIIVNIGEPKLVSSVSELADYLCASSPLFEYCPSEAPPNPAPST